MDVTLPNGMVIQGVPEDATKEQIMQKAVASGLATMADFGEAEQPPAGGIISAIGEPVKAIGVSAVGQVLAGGAGLLELAKGQGLDEAVRAIKGVQEKAAQMAAPKTQAGQESLKKVGDLVQMGIDVAEVPISGLAGLAELLSGQGVDQAAQTARDIREKGFSQTIGDRVLEETGSPILATVAFISPAVVSSLIPIKGLQMKRSKFQTEMGDRLRQAQANPELSKNISELSNQIRTGELTGNVVDQLESLAKDAPKRVADKINELADDVRIGGAEVIPKRLEKIAQEASQTTADTSLVKYVIDGAGKAKADPVAVEAIKQGFDEGVIASVKGATAADRAKMQRMIDILERGKKEALFGIKNRPSDVAGQSLLDRVDHVKQVNRNAGKELDSIAKGLKGQPAEFDPAINNFVLKLDDAGVKLRDDLTLDFRGSDFEGATAVENVLNKVVERMKSGESGATPDAYDMHRLKKYIDEQVTYGKAGEGLAGSGERILKSLRRDLDSALDSQFPEYNRVNTTYADTIGALDSLQGIAGKKTDLFGVNADKDMGTLLRRMMSNARSRVNLMDSVDELEAVARRYGGEFSDDVSVQMLFADELDSVFKPSARTGFQRSVGEGVKQGIEAATGQKTGLGMLAESAGKIADRARGINEENALKSIRELLAR